MNPSSSSSSSASELSQFAELVVRDYFRARGLDTALAAFDAECREKQSEPPGVDSWYNLSHALDLPNLLQENATQRGKQHSTILEVLVDRLLTEESLKRRVPTAVRVHGGRDQLTFQVPQRTHQTTLATPPPRLIRGAHAAVACGGDLSTGSGGSGVIAGSSGLFRNVDELSLALDGAQAAGLGDGLQAGAGAGLSVVGPGPGSGAAAGTAAAGTAAPPSSVDRPASQSAIGSKKGKEKGKRVPASSHLKGQQASVLRRAKRGGDGAKTKSDEAWIPLDARKRIFERDLLVAKLNLEEEQQRAAFVDARAKRLSLSDLEQNKAEERYKLKRKKKCGLCFREYSVVNLVLSVPHKAIVDIQNTWAEKNSEWVHMVKVLHRAFIFANTHSHARLHLTLTLLHVHRMKRKRNFSRTPQSSMPLPCMTRLESACTALNFSKRASRNTTDLLTRAKSMNAESDWRSRKCVPLSLNPTHTYTQTWNHASIPFTPPILSTRNSAAHTTRSS